MSDGNTISRRQLFVGTAAAITLPAIDIALIQEAIAATTTSTIKPGQAYFVDGAEECVLYARRWCRTLPYGLFSLADKKKIINSTTAKAGRVAIINLGSVGHVAYVVSVNNTGKARSILLAEHNIPIGTRYPRYRLITAGSNLKDAEAQAKILGYYAP